MQIKRRFSVPPAFVRGILLLAVPSCLAAYARLNHPLGPVAFQAATSGEAASYRGAVRWYIADLKPSFPEHKQYSAATALTAANYRNVLAGLKSAAKVNGIRLPIFPTHPEARAYPALYRDIVAYAHQIGLAIYASPLSVGMGDYQGWSDQRYAAWLADYAQVFAPDFLSPFNEAGLGTARVEAIVADLRQSVSGSVRLIGPDRQHVARTIEELSADAALGSAFDIVTSHNANQDRSATAENWARLVRLAGGDKPVWSSENPGNWGARQAEGLPGIVEAVDGGVAGIVIWLGKPSLIDDAGRPTQKALDIAAHLVAGP